ncbi:MAG: hypothetical protein LBQ47_01165 [Endomicrobium sp.]|jgi:hypothetical protein|nr:hypothetical protein [Endomicrobium sp.]
MTNNIISSKLVEVIACIIIFLTIFALYSKTADYGFTYHDDDSFILQNAPHYAGSNVLNIFKSNVFFGRITLYYRPVLTLSFMIDNKIAGASAQFSHFTNIILHIISCFIIYFFLRKYYFNRVFAFFAAELFAVHPLNIYTATWIPGRNDSLFLIFFLISLVFFIEYCKLQPYSISGKTRKIFYFAIHAIFLSALFFTKESAVIIPFVFLFYYFTHINSRGKALKPAIFVLWTAVTVLFFIARHFALLGLKRDPAAFLDKLNFSALYMIGEYFSGAFFLITQFGIEPQISIIITAIISVALFVFLFIKQKSNVKKMSFYFLLPFLIIGATIPGGRLWAQANRMYLPLFAIIVLCFSFFASQTDKVKKTFLIFISLFICISFYISFNKNGVFKNSESFWGQIFTELKNHPNVIQNYYATALIRSARIDEAFTIIMNSNKSDGLDASDFYNLGVYYFVKEDYKNAEFFFAKALENEGFQTSENYANLYLCAKYAGNFKAAKQYKKDSVYKTRLSPENFDEFVQYIEDSLKEKRDAYLKRRLGN